MNNDTQKYVQNIDLQLWYSTRGTCLTQESRIAMDWIFFFFFFEVSPKQYQ